MNIKHLVKLIIPTIKRKMSDYKEITRQWKRLVSVNELRRARIFLIEKKLEYERRNTDESKKYAFAVEKQLEIIDLLLEGKNVI